MDYNFFRKFAVDNEIDFIAVYGSYFKGEATENSDIDLIIDSKKQLFIEDLERLSKLLETRLNKKVDLITPQLMIPSLLCGYVWRLKEYETIYGSPVIREFA